ncbi:MAG: SDR family oxidoreductase [Hyphomicrobiales bacterium]
MGNALKGKVALVTGASSGIGKAIALRLSQAGCKLVLAGRDKHRLEQTAEQIEQGAHYVVADLAEPDDVARLADEAADCFGRVDILVANAGLFSNAPFVDESHKTTQSMIDVNLSSIVQLIHLLLPGMKAIGCGEILTIGSIAGISDMRDEAVYSATKHALNAFVRSLRRQVAKDGIRVTSILPGTVATCLWGINDQSEVDDKVEKLEVLSADDIAEIADFILTRPPNVAIRELVVLPHAQDL